MSASLIPGCDSTPELKSSPAQPLLAAELVVQLHRSYVVNLAAVSQLAAGEFWMQSGARVPVPRGREPAARTALKDYLEKQFR